MKGKPNKYFIDVDLPRPYQWQGIYFLAKRKYAVLNDDTGLGKSQPLNSQILTPEGWVKMGDIHVGMKIVGRDGLAYNVTGVHPQGKKDIYEITFSDGVTVECCNEHLWAIKDKNRSTRGYGWAVKSLQELLDRGLQYTNGDSKWSTPNFKGVHCYKEVDLPVDPYLLGALIGDGSLTCSSLYISVPPTKKEIDGKVRKLHPDVTECNWGTTNQKLRLKVNRYDNNSLLNHIRCLGLRVNSKDRFIPNIYKTSSFNQRLLLLQGLMDTDGSCTKGRTVFHTMSPVLTNDVASLTRELGGIAIVRSYDRGLKGIEFQVNVRMTVCPFTVTYKAQEWTTAKNSMGNTIVSATFKGNQESQCISVDSPDNLYVTDGCKVTHNTLQCIVALSYYKHKVPEAKALVLTEKSIVLQIAREFEWLTPGISVAVITAESHPASQRDEAFLHHNCDVIVTTYSMVYKHLASIAGGLGKGYVLICDEPNVFRNTNTELHKKMRVLAKYASRIHGLTAMLIENKLEEAYGIIKIIAPDVFANKTWFYKQYCKYWSPPGKPFAKIVTGYKNLTDFRLRVAPFVLRRKYADVNVELPEVIEQDIPVVLSRQQSLKVAEAIKSVLEMSDGSYRVMDILPALTAQQQLVNDPRLLDFDITSSKLEALYTLLEGPLSTEKVVITSKFSTQIDFIQEDLTSKKIATLRITGSESASSRETAKQKFQTGTGPCILLMTKAGSKGLNLQSGRVIVHVDLPWGYGVYKQFTGRLKRIGSTHQSIIIYRLQGELDPVVAAGLHTELTIDHHIAEVLDKKKNLFLQASGDEDIIDEDDNDMVKQLVQSIQRSVIRGRT